MEFKPFRIGDNLSYLIWCERTLKAALLDPGMNASEALRFIGHSNLGLLYIIDTHHHTDHTADNERVKELYKCKVVASKQDSAHIPGGVDVTVTDGDIIMLGKVKLQFILTPGHTKGSMCILADDTSLFTGDTLFIGDCGRTDLRDGSPEDMFATMRKLASLPDDLIVYPGHDYGDRPFDSLGNQKRTNKALLAISLKDFKNIP